MTDIAKLKSPLLTTKEAAEMIGRSYRTLENSRVTGHLGGKNSRVKTPEFIKIGGCVRYKLSTIEKWLGQFEELQNTSKSA